MLQKFTEKTTFYYKQFNDLGNLYEKTGQNRTRKSIANGTKSTTINSKNSYIQTQKNPPERVFSIKNQPVISDRRYAESDQQG
jgi:hypothetical protein